MSHGAPPPSVGWPRPLPSTRVQAPSSCVRGPPSSQVRLTSSPFLSPVKQCVLSTTGGTCPPAKTSQPEQVSRGHQVDEQEAAGEDELVSVSPEQVTVAAVKAAPVWLQSSPVLLWSSPPHLSMSPPPQPAPPPSASAPPPLPQMKVVLLFLRAPSSPMMACLSWPSPKPPRSSSGGRPRSEDRSSGGAFQNKRCSRGDGRWCV